MSKFGRRKKAKERKRLGIVIPHQKVPYWQVQATNSKNLKEVIIYTDGSCKGPGGRPGGWGAVLKFGDTSKEISGALENCTNNIAESEAIIQGLSSLKFPCFVRLYSDSEIAMTWLKIAIGKGSFRQTKKTGCKPSILSKLREAAGEHVISTFWVKGHSGVPENERCDQMASEAAKSIIEEIPADDLNLRFQLSIQ